jgi:phosphoribosylformylglycinamidine synthase
MEPSQRIITPVFQSEGEVVLLIGETLEELAGSAYLKEIYSQERGTAPVLRIDREVSVMNLVLASNDLLSSAQDLSEGGLAVALAKGCLLSKMGCSVKIDSQKIRIRMDATLFSESQSRFLVTVCEGALYKLKERIEQFDLPYMILGTTGGDSLKIQIGDSIAVDLPIKKMDEAYQSGLTEIFNDSNR